MKRLILTLCISLAFIAVKSQALKNFEIKKSFPKKEIIEDVEFMITAIEDVHPNPYHSISKEELTGLKDRIVQSLPDSLSRFDAFLTLRLLASAYKEGHTDVNMYVLNEYIGQLKNIFPIKVDKYLEGMFRIENNAFDEFDLETGDLISSIN